MTSDNANSNNSSSEQLLSETPPILKPKITTFNIILIFILEMIVLSIAIAAFYYFTVKIPKDRLAVQEQENVKSKQENDVKMDQIRIAALNNLSTGVQNFYMARKLPVYDFSDFKSISNPPKAEDLVDPETGKEYFYRMTGVNSYQLCAVFSTDSKNDKVDQNKKQSAHPKGFYCFEYSIPQYLIDEASSSAKNK